jgi:hypothetical protein
VGRLAPLLLARLGETIEARALADVREKTATGPYRTWLAGALDAP